MGNYIITGWSQIQPSACQQNSAQTGNIWQDVNTLLKTPHFSTVSFFCTRSILCEGQWAQSCIGRDTKTDILEEPDNLGHTDWDKVFFLAFPEREPQTDSMHRSGMQTGLTESIENRKLKTRSGQLKKSKILLWSNTDITWREIWKSKLETMACRQEGNSAAEVFDV